MIEVMKYFGSTENGISIILTGREDIEGFKEALHRGLNTYEDAPTALRSLDDKLQLGTDLETLKHNPRNESSKQFTTETSQTRNPWGLSDEQLKDAGITYPTEGIIIP